MMVLLNLIKSSLPIINDWTENSNENFENLFNLKTRKANTEKLNKEHADI